MKGRLRFTVLGCGSSPGVPRADGEWGACDPAERKNRRYRASLLVERITSQGKTTVIIDTGPDFRSQMLKAGVGEIDAIIYTHGHADHTNGIDDLRTFVLNQSGLMDIYADKATLQRLYTGFDYCFKTPRGSNYRPILRANEIKADHNFAITGKGGQIIFQPHLQIHGDIHSLGFRIGNIAYCTDVNAFPDETVKKLSGLDVLIIDALQYKPHPSHFSLEQALRWIQQLAPRRTILTHMHIALDYNQVLEQTPSDIEPAYDGLVFEFPAE